MSLEPPSSPNSSCRKRKRSTESDISFATSLTALSQISHDAAPLTPVSSWSNFSNLKNDQNTFSDEVSLPTRNSSLHEDHLAKRQFMSPRRRHVSLFSSSRVVSTPPQLNSSPAPSSLTQFANEDTSHRRCHVCNNCTSVAAENSYFSWQACSSCRQTTCFVCLRKCQGPCHRDVPDFLSPDLGLGSSNRDVCANCCVEVGYEGIVWCNTCYMHDDQEAQRGRYTVGKNKKEMQSERIGMVADWLNHCSD